MRDALEVSEFSFLTQMLVAHPVGWHDVLSVVVLKWIEERNVSDKVFLEFHR